MLYLINPSSITMQFYATYHTTQYEMFRSRLSYLANISGSVARSPYFV